MPADAHSHVLLEMDDQPGREIPVPPGAPVEPTGSLRIRAAQADGVVVEGLGGALLVGDRSIEAGVPRLLRPGESARAGRARVTAVVRDAGTAPWARRLLLAALRSEVLPSDHGLAVLEGPDAGRLLPLRDGVLGRGTGADLRLTDPSLSRSHARIRLDGPRVLVQDLASRNGLWLGGRRVPSLRELRPGEEMRAGRTVLALSVEPPKEQEPVPGPLARPARVAGGLVPRAALATAAIAALAAALLAAGAP